MLSIVRSGPTFLVLESNHIHEVITLLKNNLDACECNLNTSFEKSNENFTVIFLVQQMEDNITFRDISNILLLEHDIPTILNYILNNKKYTLITSSRIAPKLVFMRYFGDIQKIVDALQTNHNGIMGTLDELLESNNNGTIISFTQKSLQKHLSPLDLYGKSLFIDKNYSTLMRYLRANGLKYLNIGLDHKDWYELHIKIYDSYGEYSLHYQRLLKIIEHLEFGLVLGESWGTDSATIFYSVDIYRIRLFTFYDPNFIKKILLALEYLDNGTRIVDLDLYHKKRKINWTVLRNKEMKDKVILSNHFRNEILSNLKRDTLEEIFELENKILASRY